MKTVRQTSLILFLTILLSSCSLWNKAFPPKYGCGDGGGRNVGAEKQLDGSAPKKQKKFKS